MDAFLQSPASQRRDTYRECEIRLGLSSVSVEKDLWVCWVLRTLADLPEVGPHLFFKGGTSLSKAWRLIDRFSEDIDLVLDRRHLGFGDDDATERARSRKQQSARLDDLRRACQQAIREQLQPALQERLAILLGARSTANVTFDPADPDQQTLLLQYPSVLPQSPYVLPVVKIELGARSDVDPFATPPIRSYLADAFPELPGLHPFAVQTVAAERTFWEKAMLLHEESYRPAGRPLKVRLARHYYDLWRLITQGVAARAVADAGLFGRVAAHRAIFFRWSWMDYTTLRPGALRLVPSAMQVPVWRQDYEAMRAEMFFGEVPSFDVILHVVGDFEHQFNASAGKPPEPR